MKKLSGFSLMEMMTVLLIVSIVAAASAPMINKKMMTKQTAGGSGGSGGCVWQVVGNDIAYNAEGDDNSTVLIGTNSRPNQLISRLHIASIRGPQISLQDNNNNVGFISYLNNNIGIGQNRPSQTATNSILIGNSLTMNPDALSNDTISIGRNIEVLDGKAIFGHGNIGIGHDIKVSDEQGIAIGFNLNQIGALANGKIENSSAQGIRIGKDIVARGGIAIGNQKFEQEMSAYHNSVAIGSSATAPSENAVAIGTNAKAWGQNLIDGYSVAIGRNAKAYTSSVAIGDDAYAATSDAVVIGSEAEATHPYSVAIGSGIASGDHSVAIGSGSYASGNAAVAIGLNAEALKDDEFVLGTDKSTVYIPGKLVVGGMTYLGVNESSFPGFKSGASPTALVLKARYDNALHYVYEQNGTGDNMYIGGQDITLSGYTDSDRRLKNVGKAFAGGLAELKKLDLFHYTYKKDGSKTPHVGVMAQDLQKVFPDAVTKGDDGFLRIRLEDMFYALINAVKELANIFDKHDEKIVQLEKENKQLQKTVADLEKRLAKLEKQK